MAIISEKKAAERNERLKARTAEAAVRKYAPVQLAFWSEDRRAIANELARCALFRCRDSRKPREFYDNVELFMLGEGAITYKGEELRSRDEDLFMTLAHCAREMKAGKMRVKVTSSELCKMNNWRQSQAYYDEIFRSIQRMKGGVITVFSQRLAKALKCQQALENGASSEELARLYDELAAFEAAAANDLLPSAGGGEIAGMMLSLVSGEPVFTGFTKLKNGIPQGNLSWDITLDANLVSLFAKPYLTFVDREVRQVLTGTGKRLQTYFASHKNPYPVKLRSLEKMLGLSFKELKTLKFTIAAELDMLKSHGVIADYTFEKAAGGEDWKVTVIRGTPADSNDAHSK